MVPLKCLRESAWAWNVKNWAMDSALSFMANVRPSRNTGRLPLVQIDIDEETWRDPAWGGGAPVQAPRQALLQLIKYAIEGKAKYVLVDIIIEGSGTDRRSREDQDFAASIEELVTNPGFKETSAKLLFVRTVLTPTEEDPLPRWRFSFLDRLIKNYPDVVYPVAPYFTVSRDGVLRDWRLWEAACYQPDELGCKPAEWRVLPSVQLVIASLENATTIPRGTPWKVKNSRCDETPRSNDEAAMDRREKRPENPEQREALRKAATNAETAINRGLQDWLLGRVGSNPVPSENDPFKNRIFYSFRDFPRETKGGALEENPIPLEVMRRIRALDILRRVPDPTPMKGALVVIGQSFEEAHDLHPTPIGLMAGPTVLLNSVDSMIHVGLLDEPGPIADYGLEIVLIVLAGFVFARFEGKTDGDLVALALRLGLLPVLLISTYWIAEHCHVWWDYGLPIASIGLHRSLESLKPLIKPLQTIFKKVRTRPKGGKT